MKALDRLEMLLPFIDEDSPLMAALDQSLLPGLSIAQRLRYLRDSADVALLEGDCDDVVEILSEIIDQFAGEVGGTLRTAAQL